MTKVLKLVQAALNRSINRPRPIIQFIANRIKERRMELRKMLMEEDKK